MVEWKGFQSQEDVFDRNSGGFQLEKREGKGGFHCQENMEIRGEISNRKGREAEGLQSKGKFSTEMGGGLRIEKGGGKELQSQRVVFNGNEVVSSVRCK